MATMTLNVTDAEMQAIEELAKTKGISKTAVVRGALRLYQTVDRRIEKGDRLYYESAERMAELLFIS